MKWTLRLAAIEESVIRDKNLLYTIVSYAAVLAIFMNLTSFQSPSIGVLASAIYLVINATFLGGALFFKEGAFFRLMFGILLLIILLGFVGWLALVIHNLDVLRVTSVLLVVATVSSLFSKRLKQRNAPK